MDYYIAKETLSSLEKVIYDINIKVLLEVHKKYLKDLDFKELKNILDGITKKTYHIEIPEESDESDINGSDIDESDINGSDIDESDINGKN